jgi:1-acyl-sn-glycerol-3-phosphate acyltransferase
MGPTYYLNQTKMTHKNKTVSSEQIPARYRASRPKLVQLIGKWFLRAFNWKVEGSLPEISDNQNIIIIVGAILGLDAKISFFGKHSLFNKPILGKFLIYMGGIPVDKTKPGIGLTDIAIDNMSKLNGSLLAMSPEGTRAKTERLKSGFLRIAHAVQGKVFLAAFDFENKRILLDSFLDISDDHERDIAWVQRYYTNFKGKCPENY